MNLNAAVLAAAQNIAVDPVALIAAANDYLAIVDNIGANENVTAEIVLRRRAAFDAVCKAIDAGGKPATLTTTFAVIDVVRMHHKSQRRDQP